MNQMQETESRTRDRKLLLTGTESKGGKCRDQLTRSAENKGIEYLGGRRLPKITCKYRRTNLRHKLRRFRPKRRQKTLHSQLKQRKTPAFATNKWNKGRKTPTSRVKIETATGKANLSSPDNTTSRRRRLIHPKQQQKQEERLRLECSVFDGQKKEGQKRLRLESLASDPARQRSRNRDSRAGATSSPSGEAAQIQTLRKTKAIFSNATDYKKQNP